jgi:hypothetical protein
VVEAAAKIAEDKPGIPTGCIEDYTRSGSVVAKALNPRLIA